MGLAPILSEEDSFPVDPQVDTVTNCVNAVKDKADIFVLIIGNRFGSPGLNGASITMMEYYEAKAKGVPVYVFVLEETLSSLRFWEKNPTATFDGIVDNTKLFEFIVRLKKEDGRWVFSFRSADDIESHLKSKLSLLFSDALIAKRLLSSAALPSSLLSLSAQALKILLEKPGFWEYKLYSQILEDELRALEDLRRDIRFKVKLGPSLSLTVRELPGWIQRKFKQLAQLTASCKALHEGAVVEAFGPPGRQGDPELIAYSARRMAKVCAELYRWRAEILEVNAHEDCATLLDIVARFSCAVIDPIENLPALFESEISKTEKAIALKEGNIVMSLRIDLANPVPPEFDVEISQLTQRIIEGKYNDESD
jgi:hypothetical protein